MAKFLKIENATLTQAATSIGSFLTAKINEKNVGLATYTFTDPAIEIIPTTPNFELYDSTFYDAATSYGVAVAMTINTSALLGHLCWMLLRTQVVRTLIRRWKHTVTSFCASKNY